MLGALCLAFAVAGCQTLSPTLDQTPAAPCQPLGLDKAALLTLKANSFALPEALRQDFALSLVPCLASTDPELRDGIGYEGFATLLRAKQLTRDTIQQLRTELLASLKDDDDAAGVHRPFAALVLSEVARADRVDPVFSDAERAELVDAGVAYMAAVTDYRGFDETDGWRHGVAHTADLFLQLALNPALTTAQAEQLAAAIMLKVAPPGDHFYVYGEYQRLARPLVYLALNHDPGEAFWAEVFGQLASPAPFAAWGDAWRSQAGLARLHNTQAFATTVYTFAQSSGAPAAAPLASGALSVLRALQ
ncbi:MAG: DUF2785 domain-containing protein [Pseudomonadota bacterium]